MPRKLRIHLKNIPEHIIQRGNNKMKIFTRDTDYTYYLKLLSDCSKEFSVAIHAFVLMSNHVHILASPMEDNWGVSKMMKQVSQRYAWYFNKTQNRTGTLFEGRFTSILVQSELYLLTLYKYIELNPVRAKIVTHPGHYKWSSYHGNGSFKKIGLLIPHPTYLALSENQRIRVEKYNDMLDQKICDELLNDIRERSRRAHVLGDPRFIEQLEKETGSKLHRSEWGGKRVRKAVNNR